MRQFVGFLLSLVSSSLVVAFYSSVKAHDWIHKGLLVFWEEGPTRLVYQHLAHACVFSSVLGYALASFLCLSFLLCRVGWNVAAGISTKEVGKGAKPPWAEEKGVT